jgi:hypothetical protein
MNPRIRIAIAVAVMLVSGRPVQAQPPRDTRPSDVRGTAVISGTVVSADRTRQPLRRARVMLTGGDLTTGRTAITADDGTFAFDRLPAGRYNLTAAKDAYVTLAFGATRPNRPGARIAVADGERKVISFALPRGAVITGMITTQDGQPLPGLGVTAMAGRYAFAAGERRLALAGPAAVTDDQGVYRIFGLPAGDYAVMAAVRPGPDSPFGELEEISSAEVRRALSELKEAAAPRAKPGAAPAPRPAAAVTEPRRRVTLAPAFFPGTPVLARARVVSVAAGEERGGIDFSVDYVPTSKVEGYVTSAAPIQNAVVFLVSREAELSFGSVGSRSSRVGPDGRFSVTGVPPGNYIARVQAGSQSASADIAVNGEDLDGVMLTLRPSLTLAGQIVFEGNTPAPAGLPAMKIPVPAGIVGGAAGMIQSIRPIEVGADGRFTIPGIMPGPLRFMNPLQGIRAPIGPWWLESITIRGREILDTPLEFSESVDDAVITFTDRASELSGRVTRASADPAPDPYVVVFSVDRDRWFHNSRSVAGVRPSDDGRYVVRNLPAGEYFVAVTSEVDDREWFDPQLLQQLAAGARRVAIAGAESKTLDVVWK